MVNAGRVLSKRQILDHVWEHNPASDGNVVEPCVSYLRRKVDQGEPHLIHTIRGVGYARTQRWRAWLCCPHCRACGGPRAWRGRLESGVGEGELGQQDGPRLV